MLNATSEAVRLGSEPVGLPEFGKRVLACTVRRKPMDTEAIFKAFKKVMKFGDVATAEFIQSGEPFPEKVLTELEANGHVQGFTRSAWVEMYRVEERAPSQQVHGETRWACDAFPVSEAFDLVPTHWTEAPALEL